MKYEVTIDETLRHVEIETLPDGRYRVTVDGEAHDVDLLRPTPEAFHMLIDGESWEAGCVKEESGYLVDVLGLTVGVEVVDPRRKALRLAGGAAGGMMSTQMPGRVVRLDVKVGDAVKKGQPMLVLEAMKMENEMKAPCDGVVAEIFVEAGATLDAGTRLLRIAT